MSPETSSPFWISRFQSELDRVFREIRQLAAGDPDWSGWQPELDIVETDKSVIVVIEVPGLERDDLEVDIEGATLTVRGEKRSALPDRRTLTFQRVERQQGRFVRRIHLHWPVNGHRGRALLTDGLLIVDLPKIRDQRRKPRRLEIEEIRSGQESESHG